MRETGALTLEYAIETLRIQLEAHKNPKAVDLEAPWRMLSTSRPFIMTTGRRLPRNQRIVRQAMEALNYRRQELPAGLRQSMGVTDRKPRWVLRDSLDLFVLTARKDDKHDAIKRLNREKGDRLSKLWLKKLHPVEEAKERKELDKWYAEALETIKAHFKKLRRA